MCHSSFARTGPFILGADISWIPEDEAEGATYWDNGQQTDIFQILKNHGFNHIRLRVFVDPHSERGYARFRNEAFCDLAHTKAMAKRIKAAGMGFLLDFHYSDNWADPGKQVKPLAWDKMSVEEMTEALRKHTHDVVLALKEQGTPPDMVQIGNEITNGMLWPDGDLKHLDNLATFVKAGISAVREIDPSIKIVLHHDKGRICEQVCWWMDELLKRDVKFDIIGLSCYAQAKEGDWKKTLDELPKRYPTYDILIAEYSNRKRFVNDLAFENPKCLGTFIWEPTRHKEAIFDVNGQNAGGGQFYDLTSTQPAAPATRPATRPTTRPRRRSNGGRYETNSLIRLYDEMSKAYLNN
jgi:arabinogalactan endo-1,4-beta-galactosidase